MTNGMPKNSGVIDVVISGANRNPKVWNSEKFRFPIWNSDGQRLILSENFGQCSYHQYFFFYILPF